MAMYGPLEDTLAHAGPHQLGITVHYLEPGGALPIAFQHSDIWVERSASVNQGGQGPGTLRLQLWQVARSSCSCPPLFSRGVDHY